MSNKSTLPENPHISPFEFKGTGKEYFGIWIVNILLTIVTLGIYSAWAKVRNKQYFYGNTFLEGSSFEYTAEPKQILKGRIIAILFFILYNLVATYFPLISVILGLLLLLITPWIIMKSLAFNARYSQYRNIRFGFQQDLKESAKVFILIPLLTIFPIIVLLGAYFGFHSSALAPGAEVNQVPWHFPVIISLAMLAMFAAYPYIIYRTKGYIAGNHKYGNVDFNFRLNSAKPFYMLYAKVFLIFAIIGAIFVGLAYMLEPNLGSVNNPQTLSIESADLEGLDSQSSELENAGDQNSDTDDAYNTNDPANNPLGASYAIGAFIGQLIALGFYLFIFAYIAAHTYNIVYQNTKVGKHLLRAKMKPSELAMIYFTNTFGIILTLGLFIPWAKVRTARYRVANTALQVNGDLDNFIAVQDEQQNAFGEEFGEVFDLDVGI